MPRVNREALLRCLESVKPGLTAKEVIDQSSCFAFQGGDVITLNEEMSCRQTSGLGGKLTAAVEAKPLLETLHQWTEDEVDIEVDDTTLTVGGKQRWADFPAADKILMSLEIVDDPGEWVPLHEDFLDALQIVAACTGRDESRYFSTCVHIHPKYLEACDSNHGQAIRYRLRTGIKERAMVPHKSIKPIIDFGMTEMSETESWLHFRSTNGLRLSCRRFVEEFPDLTTFLGVPDGAHVLLPKSLAASMKKAEVFTERALIKLMPKKMRIVARGTGGGYRERKNLAGYTGERMEFWIATQLLTEIVKRHNECEVTDSFLKVNGNRFVYVVALGKSENEKKEGDE